MLPAHERLDEMLARVAQRHLGLVDQRELVPFDGAPQVAHQRQALLAVLVVALVPHGDTELVLLRRAHRDVGALDAASPD